MSRSRVTEPEQGTPGERLLYRPKEAAKVMAVSPTRMYELIKSGEIPSIKLGGTLRVPVEALRRLVLGHEAAPTAPRKKSR